MVTISHVAFLSCLLFLSCFAWAAGVGDSGSQAALDKKQSGSTIQVRLAEGVSIDTFRSSLPRETVKSVRPLFQTDPSVLDQLRLAASDSLPALKQWVEIELNEDAMNIDKDTLLAGIEYDIAEVVPKRIPEPPTSRHTRTSEIKTAKTAINRNLQVETPDFAPDQGYRDPAPDGNDAEYVFTLGYGKGEGVKIFDVEYEWRQSHEDIQKSWTMDILKPEGTQIVNSFGPNHGESVLSILSGDENGFGVTGMAPEADIAVAPTYLNDPIFGLSYSPADAIARAVAEASVGDIILLEMQDQVCGTEDYGPSEYYSSIYDAVRTAIANNVVVVAAAGNGAVDLDGANCNRLFDRTYRDSGAIIVGAGLTPNSSNPRQAYYFSSYGSRVDVQNWGGFVYAAAKGDVWSDPFDPSNPDRWYTRFSGTSSASAITAGVAASLQSIALHLLGEPLAPGEMRQILVETGTPQLPLDASSKPIGPLPDLRAAHDTILAMAASRTPTQEPSPSSTQEPTPTPTQEPTPTPTQEPTPTPTQEPTPDPCPCLRIQLFCRLRNGCLFGFGNEE